MFEWTEMILEALNEAIRERGIPYRRLARRLGLSERVLWNRMHGLTKLTADELLLLAAELDISLDDLSYRYHREMLRKLQLEEDGNA